MNIASKILTAGLLIVALPMVAVDSCTNRSCNKPASCNDRNNDHNCNDRCKERDCIERDCIVGAYTGFLSGSFYTPHDAIVAQFNPGGTMTISDVGSVQPATPTTEFVGTWRCAGKNTYTFKAVATGAFITCPAGAVCGSINDVQYLTLTGTITFDTGCQNGTGTNITFTGWTDYTLTTIRDGGPFVNQMITLLRYPNA